MKKSFKTATDILLAPSTADIEETTGAGETIEKRKPGRPKSIGYSRTSIMVNESQFAKLKYISAKEEVQLKDLFEIAFGTLLDKYEEKNGIIELDSMKKKNLKDLF